jgi:phosphoenolpyruvate phosphomutase
LKLVPGRLLRLGGAHDALSARLIEEAGLPAVWLSGFGVSAAQFALPDVNLVTLSESVEAARRVTASVKIPVVVDADNGFGDAMNAARAVREYGQAGVAGVCLEDNTFPKRCSLYPGAPRQLVSVEEMCAKLAAVRRAAETYGTFIIARVESLIAGLGSEDAVARAHAYVEVGADAILIHAREFAPLRKIAVSARIAKPLVIVPTLFREVSFADIAECGFAAVVCANQLLRAMVRAGQAAAGLMLRADSLAELDPLVSTLDDVNRLVHVPDDWCAEKAAPPPPAATAMKSKRRTCHARNGSKKPSTHSSSDHRRHHAPRR